MILSTVSSEPAFHRDVCAALAARFRFDAVWELGYGDVAPLHGLGSEQKCLNIVDFSDQARALPVARALAGRPLITTIAVNYGASREEVLLLMQAGVRDALPRFAARDLLQRASRAFATAWPSGEKLADLYAFVPARAGSGATTVATHAAGMVASASRDPILLLDFDIRAGVTTFLLRSEGTRTIADALEQAGRLDAGLWSGLISPIGNLHLLGSGAVSEEFAPALLAERFRELLDFAVRQYSVVAVDLPGSLEDYECNVLERARRIYLVCTPDTGALHAARRKAEWLDARDLADKAVVVMNCVESRGTLSVGEIESIIQLPVRYSLPADAYHLTQAGQQGEILAADGPLGREVAAIAAEIEHDQAKREAAVRGILLGPHEVCAAADGAGRNQ